MVLRWLREHGQWYVGCGWTWGSYSATRRLTESLAARVLVSKKEVKTAHGTLEVYTPITRETYERYFREALHREPPEWQ